MKRNKLEDSGISPGPPSGFAHPGEWEGPFKGCVTFYSPFEDGPILPLRQFPVLYQDQLFFREPIFLAFHTGRGPSILQGICIALPTRSGVRYRLAR